MHGSFVAALGCNSLNLDTIVLSGRPRAIALIVLFILVRSI
jgi:hypothetical protein